MRAIMFLSVDVINSTQLKQTDRMWPSLFKSFYVSFPKELNRAIDRQKPSFKRIQRKGRKALNLQHPRVWKLIGDEILFYLELSDYYEQLLFTTIAFRNALREHNRDNKDLKIRGTIWFANVNDKTSNMRFASNVQGRSLDDFLGTAIDIGFRLCGYSSFDKLVISSETAILLIRDNHLTLEEHGIHLCFGGTTKLRGFEPTLQEYPLIWIDASDERRGSTSDNGGHRKKARSTAEMQNLMREMQMSSLDKLVRYCQLYIESSKGRLVYPYVPRDRLFG
jgi:hypothetical protein